MIRLTYSNRTEELARALAERVGERTDPLRAVTIVVPNRAMERWVEVQLAQHLGIAANLRFVRLEGFVRDQLARLGAGTIAEPAEIEGRLLAILLDPAALAREPELDAVRHYLLAAGTDEDATELRAVQLARRLARLFQEYGFSRAAMLDAWSKGELALEATPLAAPSLVAIERWQRALFLRVREGHDDRTLGEALRALREAPRPRIDPEAVHVFGVSYVARAFQDAIASLAPFVSLDLYALNPCQEFWEDALSDVEQRRARRTRARTEEDPFALLAENDSPLLRAWGRPGREHVAMLDELTGFDARARFDDALPSTLLGRVQRSILHRTSVHDGGVQPGELDPSIRVLACPSIRREIETVATEIWSLVDRSLATDRPIRLHEIAVLVHGPDRDRYVPHLEAVFADSHDLPWNAGDLALSSRSRVADCALRLIDLEGSSFSRAEVLEIVAHPLVLARWSDAEPSRVAMLCDRLGVFHGIDARDHAGTYLEAGHGRMGAVHWDQAIRRLALGSMMEGERSGRSEPFESGSLTLLPEEIDPSDELANGLGLLVRSLASDARFARTARLLPSEWARFFSAMLRAYVVPSDGGEESEHRRCVAALEELGRRDAGARIGYRVAVELARAELEALPASRGAPGGDGVVVASLLPMRAIPFRAIFVLGLGEGRFPSRELDTGLDLRAAQRQPGDVASDERDRYTFLETLLCARESLVLSYVARDDQTGEPREPSSIVHALDEAVGAPLPRTIPPLRRYEVPSAASDPIVAHALPSAAAEAQARAAGAAHRRALADVRFPEAALARLEGADPRRALLAMPAIPPREADDARPRISLAQLRGFLECPIQGHASAVLGALRDGPDAAIADEPFEADRGTRESLLRDVFLAAFGHDDAALERAYHERVARGGAHGEWPLGALARLREEDDLEALSRWRHALEAMPPDLTITRVRFGGATSGGRSERERPRDPLAVSLGSGREKVELVGATQWLAGNDALLATTSSLEGEGERAKVETLRRALHAFVDHAVLSLAGLAGTSTRRAWVLDGSGEGPIAIQLAPMRPVAAERWLAGVIDDLARGPHGLFLPCEAVLRMDHLFSRGSSEPSIELARSIEEVRTKSPWQGGSSRWGAVREAVEHPAPEPAQALAIASRRFGAFFDHLRGYRRQS